MNTLQGMLPKESPGIFLVLVTTNGHVINRSLAEQFGEQSS